MEYYLGLNSEEKLNHKMLENFSGVGMIRGENLCINRMQYFTITSFCNYVTEYLDYVAKEFEGKPVWYRTADLVPHQINELEGCDEVLQESQYLIGNRGIRRNLQHIDTYLKEIESFLKAYRNNPNLGILIPFVSTVEEVKTVKDILSSEGYTGKIGIMLEIPSAIVMLDEINALGVDYYTLGLNDLTTMILGAKRDISIYDMNNEAVQRVIKNTINKIHALEKKVTIAGYLNPETIQYGTEIGADHICIHYNEIPMFFATENEEEYTSQYNDMKKAYQKIKKERQGK